MTPEQVIELAKQAGMGGMLTDIVCTRKELETYTRLVRDQYRAELLAGSGEPVAQRELEEWLDANRMQAIGSLHHELVARFTAAVLRARREALEEAVNVAHHVSKTCLHPEEITDALRNMKDNT